MNANEKTRPFLSGLIRILGITVVLLWSSTCLQCRSLPYYEQAIDGQMQILQKRQPIADLIDDPETPPQLRDKLKFIQSVRAFAAQELLLPVDDHYLSYVELNRPYVVWNVFAAPELSLTPKTWCFPIVGCVAYRGYFKEDAARRFADGLAQEGFDVYIGGAIAYSTLGWFDDPVLSTFIHLSSSDTVALIVHELAHGVLYIPDDTAFNESFATAVEQEGLRRWQIANRQPEGLAEWKSKRRHRQKFIALVSKYREQLQQVYESSLSTKEKRDQKAVIFDRMRSEFRMVSSHHHGMAVYNAWFKRPLNNAQLISVSTYHDWVPAFSQMLSDSHGNLEEFYEKCRQLAEKEPAERRRVLTRALQIAQPGPNQNDAIR